MIDKKYNSTLSRNRFLFQEARVVTALKLRGLTKDEIRRAVKEENLFQYKNRTAIGKSLGMVIKRLSHLDSVMINALAGEDQERAKIALLYSIWVMDRLFREFISEVVSEKIQTRQFVLLDSDLRAFFQGKVEQSSLIASWTETTIKDLRNAYLRILSDIGMLNRKTRELRPLLVAEDLNKHLISIGGKDFLSAVTGGRE